MAQLTPLAPAPLPAPPRTAPEAVPAAPPCPRRRGILGALLALTGLAGTAGALSPLLRASRTTAPAFTAETYGGRRLVHGPDWATIDGRALHLMPRADGGFVSAVDHFTPYPTAGAAARAAVDELGGARLSTPAYGA
jgi:hypothetical protein